MRNAFILLCSSLILSACASMRPPQTPVCLHRAEAVEKSIGFCQSVRVGDVLYISGVVGAAPMEAAIPKVYEQLRRDLEANGLSFANVVKENVYATDLDAFISGKEERKRFYGATLPAATWVQVSRLYSPGFVLEVELIAHYPR